MRSTSYSLDWIDVWHKCGVDGQPCTPQRMRIGGGSTIRGMGFPISLPATLTQMTHNGAIRRDDDQGEALGIEKRDLLGIMYPTTTGQRRSTYPIRPHHGTRVSSYATARMLSSHLFGRFNYSNQGSVQLIFQFVVCNQWISVTQGSDKWGGGLLRIWHSLQDEISGRIPKTDWSRSVVPTIH